MHLILNILNIFAVKYVFLSKEEWSKVAISTSYRTVYRTMRTIFSEFKDFLGKIKARKSLNEESMSILHEEPSDNLFIVNILFFICKSSYNVKDIDVTKHVVAMVGTASKTSKSHVLINFIFNVWILHFCNKKVLQRVSNKHNIEIFTTFWKFSKLISQIDWPTKSHILLVKHEIWNILFYS